MLFEKNGGDILFGSNWLSVHPSCHAISSEMVVQKFTKLRSYDHHMARTCDHSVIFGPVPLGGVKR